MSSWEHRLDIYETDLIVCTTRKDWNAARKRYKVVSIIEPVGNSSDGVTCRTINPRGVLTIWIFVDGGGHQEYGTVWLAGLAAHEATHAAEAICSHHEFSVGGEPMAYLVGWLTKSILSVVDESLNTVPA